MSTPVTLTALLHGPDQTGLVARVAGWIFQRRGNILHADQHRDREAGIFFQRIEWELVAGVSAAVEEKAFLDFAQNELKMQARIADSLGYKVRVQNAGLSGETSAGALRRADWLLKDSADVVVIETGANDGLRGLQVDTTRANIEIGRAHV